MGAFGWVLATLVGWSAIGLLGTALAFATGDRCKAMRSGLWIAGVWLAYLAVLAVVSVVQRQRIVALGQEECFGKVCFSVSGMGAVPQRGGRVVQVAVQVRNSGKDFAEVEGLRAYLVDSEGRRWEQTRGVGGNPLTIRLASGRAAVSEPVFRVGDDSAGLGLVLTRGRSGLGWLTVGDSDSLWHRKTVLRLE